MPAAPGKGVRFLVVSWLDCPCLLPPFGRGKGNPAIQDTTSRPPPHPGQPDARARALAQDFAAEDEELGRAAAGGRMAAAGAFDQAAGLDQAAEVLLVQAHSGQRL